MFILRDILPSLQSNFSDNELGRKRAHLFVYTLLAIIVPFTSSMTSNLLRSLQTLFGLDITRKPFYAFMASPALPWHRLWPSLWGLIPAPLTYGRLVLALDDYINPKVGRKIFGCESFFDHAAKANQSKYPWAQNVVAIGLLKVVKNRWAWLPMAFDFYLLKKAVDEQKANVKKDGKVVSFQTKLAQAADMIIDIASHFIGTPVLVVTDSWFGNNGLFKPARNSLGMQFQLLSRLRSNSVLYGLPPEGKPNQRGRPRKYGRKFGTAAKVAARLRRFATTYSIFLYGKQRDVIAYDRIYMLKTLKCTVRVVWVYRKNSYLALFTTDLRLSVEQIISLYGARWKIESGFKEIKQELGSSKTQTRNAHAVLNHLNFCMMATTITWIYADRLRPDPQRRHKVKGRVSFAFSDVRHLIAEAALTNNFDGVCLNPIKPLQKSFLRSLLRMVA